MKVILTLDVSNADRLKKLQHERGIGFEELVNDAIRIGLDQLEKPTRLEPFRTPVFRGAKANFETQEELKELMLQIQFEEDLRKIGLLDENDADT